MDIADRDIIARIPKTETAEVRVSRTKWKGRKVVDVRIWFVPVGGRDFVPSRKGFTFEAAKLQELIAALQGAVA